MAPEEGKKINRVEQKRGKRMAGVNIGALETERFSFCTWSPRSQILPIETNWPPEIDVSYAGMYAAAMMPKAPSPLFPICCLPSSSTLISVISVSYFFPLKNPNPINIPPNLPVTHCSQPSLTNLELNYMTHVVCVHHSSVSCAILSSTFGLVYWTLLSIFFLRDEHTLQQKHQLLQTN